MSLGSIVRALGGELYDAGRRANIPAPGHSGHDRSVSLLLQHSRVVVHTFGGSDWKAVLDHLRAHGLIDGRNAPVGGPGQLTDDRPGLATVSVHDRIEVALRLWDEARPLGRTLSARHCRLRGWTGALPGPRALRHHGDTPVSIYRPGGLRRPALLAGIQDAMGRYTAVEVTYLAPNGRRAMDLRLPRKTVGLRPPGSAVRLDPAAGRMLVAEGVFTTLAAKTLFGLPGWALLSTNNLRAWSPPAETSSVLIAADRGRDGEASAEILRGRLLAAGVGATIALPPAPWGDWDDWVNRAERPAMVRRREEGTGSGRQGAG